MSVISQLKQSTFAVESYVRAQRISQPRRLPCVIMFTSQIHTGSAGDLRARAIGRELRRIGWRTIIVPPQLGLRERQRLIAEERPHVLFLQQSWHPLNRPALYPEVPCVFDADDANFLHDPEMVAECCRGSRAVIAGSHYIAEFFSRYNSDVSVIWTGTYVSPRPKMTLNAQRRPVITWAQNDPLGFPEEAAFVREVILRLSRRLEFSFYLYGVRDRAAAQEYLAPVREAGIDTKVIMFMRYPRFVWALEEAAIGLQPVCCPFSRGKNFGKLLAYIVSGVAAVVSNAFEYPLFFRQAENGMLASSVEEWVECCRFLLDCSETRGRIAAQAYLDFQRDLTTKKAAERVEQVLHRVVTGSRNRSDFDSGPAQGGDKPVLSMGTVHRS